MMDTLFFIASKTLGMVARVETWMILGLALCLYAIWRNRRAMALSFGLITLALITTLTIWPLGDILLGPLEATYPASPSLTAVDGIIVLGGAEQTDAYRKWGGAQLNDGGERMTEGVILARRFPHATLIFSGGEAALGYSGDTNGPSDLTKLLWLSLGVPEAQIQLESKSRNTTENARFTYAMIQPQPGQHYLLVTSAFHMRRAMETFRRAGWQDLTAWPVDYRSGDLSDGARWRLDQNLEGVDIALKEYLGLFVYWITGR
ncbi:MAG: YdcF family protein [bacterium]